jgi:D-alanyl-D-alanine carboxypeptidase (penicillin-binding protein 5/6)
MVKKSLILISVFVLSVCAALACPKCGGKISAAEAIAGGNPAVTAKAAYLVEGNSGKVIFAKDETKRLPIASMVKITTLAVVYDALKAGQINMAQKVMVSSTASGMGGSQAFLDFNSEYAVEDLVKSIITASANDSCVALAETIAGSESEFVARMNNLADKLGMTDTRYANCTGLPAAESYSCARDVSTMYRYLMQSPYYGHKVGGESINKIWMYDLVHPSGRVTGLTNTNKHIRFFNGCLGGKTGFTAEAGHCITVCAERGNLKPVAVIIGASDSATRFAESASLLNYVFDNFESRQIVDTKTAVGKVTLKNAVENQISAFPQENYFTVCRRGEKTNTAVSVEMADSAKAPIKQNAAIGKIIVTNDGVVVKEIAIVPEHKVNEISYFDAVKKVIGEYKIF